MHAAVCQDSNVNYFKISVYKVNSMIVFPRMVGDV